MGAVEVLPFECGIIRTLCDTELGSSLIDSVFRFSDSVSLEHSGVGYFLTLSHANLPMQRGVFNRPHIRGRLGVYRVGYLVFVGNRELMLECFSYEDALPEDARNNDFVADATDNVFCGDAS